MNSSHPTRSRSSSPRCAPPGRTSNSTTTRVQPTPSSMTRLTPNESAYMTRLRPRAPGSARSASCAAPSQAPRELPLAARARAARCCQLGKDAPRMDRDYELQTHRAEDRHWWYRGRRRVLERVIGALELPPHARILDAG